MRNFWQYVVVAVVFLGAGSAAGLTVAPRLRAPGPCTSQASDTDLARADSPGVQVGRKVAKESAQLGFAAAVLSQVPKLRPEQPSPHVHGPSDHRRLDRKDLPPAVEAVLQQATLGRRVHGLELERRERNGQPVFLADLDIDGVEHEFTIDEQGKVLESERDLALSELPAAVTTGIQTALPGAILMEAEYRTRDGRAVYEVELRLDRHRHELLVGEDGGIVRQRSR